MRVALRELIRRPGRFLPVGGALTLLVLLLVVLGGFLDGLALDQTGAFRAQGDDRLWVLDDGAELQLSRSAVAADTAERVAAVDGVAAVGGIGTVATTTSLPGDDELADVAVFGYERGSAVLPDPPGPGEVVVDRRLLTTAEVAEGDVLEVGPDATPLTVTGFVDDATQGSPTLWAEPATWREVANAATPASPLPPDAFQALVVEPVEGADLDELAARIDDAGGATQTAGLDELLDGQPVVAQQTAVFQGIIAVTFVVALLVVALFFALLALERLRLYAVLKAIGGRSRDLVAGVTAQAVVISVGALATGAVLAVAIVAVLPPDLPVRLVPGRLAVIAAGTVGTAVVGALFTLRRILRIDPAAAIG